MHVLTWHVTGNTDSHRMNRDSILTPPSRLKISLNLPPIDARPPVPPRIYKRLYNHLDHILPNHTPNGRTPRVRTPSAKLREQDNFLGSRSKASFLRTTPGKERSLADFRSPSASQTATPSKTGRASARKAVEAGLPPWVRPTLRHLCRELDATSIGSTVVAGMEAIVCPHGRRTEDEWVLSHMTSLLGALYLYVWNAVSMPDGVDAARYVSARKDLVEALQESRHNVYIKDFAQDEAWEGWQDIQAADIDSATMTVNRHGWLESDWALGIQDLIRRGADRAAEKAGASRKGNRAQIGPVRRTDTMLQDKYNYLSEKRRNEYETWKKRMMKEITRLERQKAAEEARWVDI